MSKARKVENEDGSVMYVASDGREFKSKSGWTLIVFFARHFHIVMRGQFFNSIGKF